MTQLSPNRPAPLATSSLRPRIVALNPLPTRFENSVPHDLAAKLAGVKALRATKRGAGALSTYITSAAELAQWGIFHAAIADGNFTPLLRSREQRARAEVVEFGLVVARPFAEWLRSHSHRQVLRQIEAGLAALYCYSDDEQKQAMRCQLHGPVLDRVLELHERCFVGEKLDLFAEEQPPSERRAAFDRFVFAHAGATPPPAFPLLCNLSHLFLGADGDVADMEVARREEACWFYSRADFSLTYWLAHITHYDWERIVERSEYDELQRVEGSPFLYAAWEEFYEANRLQYPLRQSHWRDLPAEVTLLAE